MQGVGLAAGMGAKRESNMNEQIGRLDRELSGLDQSLDALLNRIDALMRPSPPVGVDDINKPGQMLGPMADQIRSYAERASAARRRIEAAIDRLDV